MCLYPEVNVRPTQVTSEQITLVLKRCNSIISLMRLQTPRDYDARTMITPKARADGKQIWRHA